MVVSAKRWLGSRLGGGRSGFARVARFHERSCNISRGEFDLLADIPANDEEGLFAFREVAEGRRREGLQVAERLHARGGARVGGRARGWRRGSVRGGGSVANKENKQFI